MTSQVFSRYMYTTLIVVVFAEYITLVGMFSHRMARLSCVNGILPRQKANLLANYRAALLTWGTRSDCVQLVRSSRLSFSEYEACASLRPSRPVTDYSLLLLGTTVHI